MENFELNIEPIKFEWGQLLSDIKLQLEHIDHFENDNGYSNFQILRVPIKSFMGIKTNSVVFSSPFKDRIVNSIKINIAFNSNTTIEIVKSLNNKFGNPTENGKSKNYGNGSVPEYFKWKSTNCDIGLSIYGGVRNEYGEENKGMIWLFLRNIELLSNLYSSNLEFKNNLLNNREINILKRIRTDKLQKQSHFLEKENYPEHDQDFISTALNSYMKRDILLTPAQLGRKMEESEICLFESKSSNAKFLANKFECIELIDIKKFIWIKTHPAKGAGNNRLEVNDLVIWDNYSSNAIEELSNTIKDIANIKYKFVEVHDC